MRCHPDSGVEKEEIHSRAERGSAERQNKNRKYRVLRALALFLACSMPEHVAGSFRFDLREGYSKKTSWIHAKRIHT